MKTLFTLVQVLAVTFLFAKHKTVTIDKAYKSGIVKLKIRGTGTYKGNCLKMTLQNNTDDSLYILLEAGRRLDSKNNKEQDILVTKEQIFKLESHQKKDFSIYGFCCQASNHAPSRDSLFSIGKLADTNLVSLAKFCNINKFTVGETQSAVWCVSDRRPLASISASNESLRYFVSKITKEEMPWYQLEYHDASSNTVFSDRVERVTGNIMYTLTKDDFYKIELHDAKGKLIQNFTENKVATKGTYDYWFNMQVSNYPKGKYYIHIYNGNELVTKKEFVI